MLISLFLVAKTTLDGSFMTIHKNVATEEACRNNFYLPKTCTFYLSTKCAVGDLRARYKRQIILTTIFCLILSIRGVLRTLKSLLLFPPILLTRGTYLIRTEPRNVEVQGPPQSTKVPCVRSIYLADWTLADYKAQTKDSHID